MHIRVRMERVGARMWLQSAYYGVLCKDQAPRLAVFTQATSYKQTDCRFSEYGKVIARLIGLAAAAVVLGA